MINLILVCDCSRKNQTKVFLNSFKQIKWLMMKNIVKSWKLAPAWEKYLPKNKKKYLPIEWKLNSMFCAFCAKVTFRFSCLYLANQWKFHIKLISPVAPGPVTSIPIWPLVSWSYFAKLMCNFNAELWNLVAMIVNRFESMIQRELEKQLFNFWLDQLLPV